MRCIHCIRHNEWLETQTDDVEETEVLLMKQSSQQTHTDQSADSTAAVKGQ